MAAVPIEKDPLHGPVPTQILGVVAAQMGSLTAPSQLYETARDTERAHSCAAPAPIRCSIRSEVIRTFSKLIADGEAAQARDQIKTMSKSFLTELKRRNVIRMAGLYLVGAWLLVQVAGTVLPMFGAPDG